MIDTTIEELMQENATLRAEFARLQALPVWEPVKDGEFVRDHMNSTRITYHAQTDAYPYPKLIAENMYEFCHVALPDNIRLCRLVSQEA